MGRINLHLRLIPQVIAPLAAQVELEDGIIKPELNMRIESMDNDIWLPLPALESMLPVLGHKPIAFDTASARIVAGNHKAASHGVATNGTVGEPYFMLGEEPVRIMR